MSEQESQEAPPQEAPPQEAPPQEPPKNQIVGDEVYAIKDPGGKEDLTLKGEYKKDV